VAQEGNGWKLVFLAALLALALSFQLSFASYPWRCDHNAGKRNADVDRAEP
jgi:hypothetical protein